MNAQTALWARTTVRTWPESYRLVSLPVERWSDALAWMAVQRGTFAGIVRERDEVSLTVEDGAWSTSPLRDAALHVSGHYRAVTLDLQIELSVVGYLAPAAARLAAAGVSIVPQCAFLRDHVLVPADDVDRAVQVLQGLVDECRRQAP